MLGNSMRAYQSPTNNTTNVQRQAQAAGLRTNQPVPWSQIPQGMTLNTPRDWSAGGLQRYSPQAATVDPRYAGGLQMGTGGKGGGGMRQNWGGPAGTTAPNAGRMGGMGGFNFPAGGQSQMGGQGMGGPGMASISTSIMPQSIYPEWMTNSAVNQVQAQADQASSMPYLLKMFDRPGASRSEAHLGAALPFVAQAQTQATAGRAQIPFEDMMANQRNLFLGQVARENEGLQYGNLAARMAEAQQSNRFNDLNRQYSLLSQLVG